ncbi:MAG: Rpn family recombination-promoting nuclease/putative transposase [Lachnospiraceae bacterium]|nr:Rpn family recombination-promoting nuclease/putative transposase [Lachnospiraceae bacterium]
MSVESLRISNQYKDRVFRALFGNPEQKENILSLYNTLNGTNYKNTKDLFIETIDDVIYVGMKNDAAFLIDCCLSLYEHQSTLNPNMPLRGFMYFVEMYSRYVTENDFNIYSSKQIKIPAPQYYVFYNGDTNAPDRKVLYLSDAFEAPVRNGEYEWTATMLNINFGHNHQLMEKCAMLKEYSVFVERVKTEVKDSYDLRSAIEKVIDSCIADGILADFLKVQKAEVIEMCITQYNEKEVMDMLEREAKEIGHEKGREETLEEVVKNMKKNNCSVSEIQKYTGLDPQTIARL